MTLHHRPRPLSAIVPAIAGGIFGRKSLLFGQMLGQWVHIAGADIASCAAPLDIKYAAGRQTTLKNKATTKDRQAVLHIAVQPARALEVSYQKSLLIERLNMFFGYAAIKDIKIIQNSEVMNTKRLSKPFARRLTPHEEGEIDGLVAGIGENDLQIALKNLGKAIRSRQ